MAHHKGACTEQTQANHTEPIPLIRAGLTKLHYVPELLQQMPLLLVLLLAFSLCLTTAPPWMGKASGTAVSKAIESVAHHKSP